MRQNKSRLTKLLLIFIPIFILLILKNEILNLSARFPAKITEKPFVSLKKNEIKEIRIFKNNKNKKIYRKENSWYIKENGLELKADGEKINELIENLRSLKKDNIVSENRNKHRDLGIDRQRIEIKYNDKNDSVFIGNSIGTSVNYVRFNQENEVFTAEGIGEFFSSDDFRDLSLHVINDETKVTLLEINQIKLEKKEQIWKLNTQNAKKDRIDFYVNDLKTLKATDILAANTVLPDSPYLSLKITENKKGETLVFYSNDENNYLAKSSASKFIYQIPAASVSSLIKVEKDFLE